MPTKSICAECGAELSLVTPSGLCARCLFTLGLRASSQSESTQDSEDSVTHLCVANSSQSSGSLLANERRRLGDYELVEEIARGGMGIVYRAWQRSLDRVVAVKTLLFGPQASPEFVKRFRAEAAAAASLQHPNIVAIHQVGVQDGHHYLVMQLIEGPSLALWAKEHPVSARRAAEILKAVAEAVHYAHERGILHRDLKPSNILMDADGQPHVADFGLAKRFDGDSSLTITGQMLGSPSYMPPEQAGASRGKVSRRSDVYSLGAMLYHLLAGRPPFVGETVNETLDQVFHREPLAPRLLDSSVPHDLETICVKCLEKEPARRYPTAQALADELSRFLNHEPIQARPVHAPGKLWRWCRRRPALAATIALLQIALVGGFAGVFWQWHRAEQNLYVANVRSAYEALNSHDLARMQALVRDVGDSAVQHRMRGWEWRYLDGRAQAGQKAILSRHSSFVWEVAASPTGSWLASIDGDGQVQLWDFAARQLVKSWVAHSDSRHRSSDQTPHGLLFTPDSKTLITIGVDHRLRGWEIPTGKNHFDIAGPSGTVRRLAISHDGHKLALGTAFGSRVRLVDLASDPPATVHDWDSKLSVFSDAAFAPDGLTLFLGGPTEQQVQLFDLHDPQTPNPLPALPNTEGPLAISPDGQWLVTAQAGGQRLCVRTWPALTPVATNTVQGSALDSLQFSPDSQRLAAGLEDGRVLLWSRDLAGEPITMLGHELRIMGLAFSTDGGLLASASVDKTVRVWDTNPRENGAEVWRVAGSGHDVAFSPDSKRVVTVSHITSNKDAKVPQRLCVTQLWEIENQRGLKLLASQTNRAVGLNFRARFSPDGKMVAVDSYGRLDFLEVPALTVTTQKGWRLPRWGPDGSWLTYLENGVLVRADSPAEPAHEWVRTGGVTALAMSPNGRMLATADAGDDSWPIKLWDAESGRTLGTPLKAHKGWVTSLEFSPDGKLLVSTGWSVEGLLIFWDVSQRQELARHYAHNGSVFKLSFSQAGKTLATCGGDETVRLWNVARLQEVAVLRGHRSSVSGVAFSPDDRWLASISTDGEIRLWSAPEFKELGGVSPK